jgi:hypothetical protein
LTLADCTVAGNQAGFGGGIETFGPTTLENTIVADNPAGGAILGSVSGSHNLVDAAAAGGLVNGVNGNIVGVDPRLGALGYNGGLTRTMALLPGSPAIGKGAAIKGVSTDQRGFPLDSPAPDIGAFQYQGAPPTVTISGPTTGIVQVEGTFTITATDPSPADQAGTFTYTIDWNGDGSDIQTIQGAASLQVAHAYHSPGSYSPSVTALDHDRRSSGVAMVASPIVVSPLDSNSVSIALTNPTVVVDVSSVSEAAIAVQSINGAPPTAWSANQDVHLSVTGSVMPDTSINPSSPDAQIDVSGPDFGLLGISQYASVSNPYVGVNEGVQEAAFVATLVTLALIGGAAAGEGSANALTDFSDFIQEVDNPSSSKAVFEYMANSSGQAGVLDTTLSVALVAGTESIPFAKAAYAAVGSSPALTVDQGIVTWSNSIMGTATDASTIVVRGGTLMPQGNFETPRSTPPRGSLAISRFALES